MKRRALFEDGMRQQLKTGLLHYYNFDGNAQDVVAGVNGVLSDVAFGETNGVKVSKFNGSSSKIEFPPSVMVQGNGVRTINAWIKPNIFTSNQMGVFGNYGAYLGISFMFNTSGQFYVWHGIGDVGINVDTSGLNMWTYQFLGGLVTNAKLYKNGQYVGKLNLVAGTNGNLNTQPTYNILGHKPRFASWDQIGGYYFDGDIGYFGVWDRVLTDKEIVSLYNKGRGFKI